MKHKFADDVNVHVDHEFDVDDVSDVIEKARDAAITIIIVATAAQVVKKFLTETPN